MLSELVAVGCGDGACLEEVDQLLLVVREVLCATAEGVRVEGLCIFGHHTDGLAPVPCFILSGHCRHNSEPIVRLRHQVCDDALMGAARIDLSELLNLVDLGADSVLKLVA